MPTSFEVGRFGNRFVGSKVNKVTFWHNWKPMDTVDAQTHWGKMAKHDRMSQNLPKMLRFCCPSFRLITPMESWNCRGSIHILLFSFLLLSGLADRWSKTCACLGVCKWMPHDIWFVRRALEFILYQILTRLCFLKALDPSKKALTCMAPGNSSAAFAGHRMVSLLFGASYLRQEASQRAQKLTNEVSSTCMRGGKSLKLKMAPIIRKSSKKKKHPRNISRCCVSFRVCIFACFSF